MMKTFTVYDSKAEAYHYPYPSITTATGIRSMESAVNGGEFKQHAADYTLFETGTWDELTGEFTNLPAKINLGNGLEFVAQDSYTLDPDNPEETLRSIGIAKEVRI